MPRHCTRCTQKLLFWLRFLRLPEKSSGKKCKFFSGRGLLCWCSLPRVEPYLELGSFSFMFQSFLQGAEPEGLGAQHHCAPIPAFPGTPLHAGFLSSVTILCQILLYCIPRQDYKTPSTGRGSL